MTDPRRLHLFSPDAEVPGVRNNNPGNIRRSTYFVWKHQIGTDKEAFCIFSGPEWGIRAMGILFQNYEEHDGCKTLTDFISRWAPPTENDTAAYIAFVSNKIGVLANQPLDIHTRGVATARAIGTYECGYDPYPFITWQRGIHLSHEH